MCRAAKRFSQQSNNASTSVTILPTCAGTKVSLLPQAKMSDLILTCQGPQKAHPSTHAAGMSWISSLPI